MTIDQLTPLNDRILVEVIPDETQAYEGSIVTMDYSQEKSNIAIVISVPEGYNVAGLEKGSKVIFNRHAGSVLKLDKFDHNAAEYRLLKDTDLLALIQGDNQQ
jgi:co-chaperonin GroES (HSP10)